MMISQTQNHELELRKKISPALLLIDDPDETVSSHIIEHLISFGGSIAPIIRTELKGQDIFTGFNQNDLPEFLIFIIDCFHNA